MGITIKLLVIILFNLIFEGTTLKETEKSQLLPLIQSEYVPSGFYLLNNEIGIKKILQGTTDSYYVDQKLAVTLAAFKKVKVSFVTTKRFKKTEKSFGLLFKLKEQGKEAFTQLTKNGYKTHQKIGLILQDQLVLAAYINTEINNDTFFIELDIPNLDLKALEKRMNTEIKHMH